jgi:hypothetical protein
MNILYLIGNGFDLNLGLKTSYKDFYNHYNSQKSSISLIQELKKYINNNIVDWADLELELGKYTKHIKSTSEFFDLYEDIQDRLAEYLQLQENEFDFDKIERKRFFEHLSIPENSLLLAMRQEVKKYREKWKEAQWNVNIITFNYTSSIEKIINDKLDNLIIGSHHRNIGISLRGVHHIHGDIDNRMVLGVNDKSQIDNKSLCEDQDVEETLVKVTCNQAIRDLADSRCAELISNANLICIFGSSIGDTDRHWWELIGKQLAKECRLLIFCRGKKISPRRPQRQLQDERTIRNLFIEKAGIQESVKNGVANKIYVGVNTNLFNLTGKL